MLSCNYPKVRLGTELHTDSLQGQIGTQALNYFFLQMIPVAVCCLSWFLDPTPVSFQSVGLLHLDDALSMLLRTETVPEFSFPRRCLYYLFVQHNQGLFPFNFGQFIQHRWIYKILVTLQLLCMNKMLFQGYCITLF